VSLLLLALLAAPATEVAAKVANDALDHGPIAGLSIAVARGGKIELNQAFGLANLETSAPATTQTVYKIQSTTKAFTAAAILRLVEAGKLRLEDHLSTFFPEWTLSGYDPSLVQMLDHSSGLTSYGGAPFQRNIKLDLSPRQWVESIDSNALYLSRPGAAWSYSNLAYDILGLIIEKVAGEAYERFVLEQVVSRAGVTGARFCNTNQKAPDDAQSYENDRRGFRVAESWGTYGAAAGRLCMTAVGLAGLFVALQNGAVVSPQSLAAMRTPGKLANGTEFDYGLGTRLGSAGEGHPLIAWTGDGEGWTAAAVAVDGLVVVALSNTDSQQFHASALATRIALGILDLPEPPAGDAPVPPALAAAIAGRWRGVEGRVIEQVPVGDRVHARLGKMEIPLRYQGGTTFVAPDGSRLVFRPDGTSANVYQNGIFTALTQKL
jgi:CubicO group peptidase (beta-lactamase class C family)